MKFRLVMMLALSFLVLAACVAAEEPGPEPAAEPAPAPDGTRENPYVGRGVVQEVGEGQLLIGHETIPEYMAAMTMAFSTTDDVDLSEFSVGDQIMFDLELAGGTGQIFHIEVEPDGTREHPYVGRGVVEEVGNGELLINHGTIPGWMAAMTMAFPTTDEVDLSALEVGAQIMFNVDLEGAVGYQVFHIEPVED